jgi:transcriptional regulator with XRE-family HTH domain
MTVKRFRVKRKMTQAALAEQVGVHRIYIAKIEAGTQVPSIGTLEKIAAALRVKPGRLLD